MEIVKMMNLFQLLFRISIGVTALGFLLTVLSYFLFDIRTQFAMLSGRAREKALARMRSREESGGSMREKANMKTDLQHSGSRIVESSDGISQLPRTEEVAANAMETTDLYQANETSLLFGEKLETTVLSQKDSAYAPDPWRRTQPLVSAPADLGGLNFTIIEERLFVHTEEII